MKKVKFIKFTMAFFACVLAVTMGSCDKNDDPKVPDLKCTPSKVEVAPGDCKRWHGSIYSDLK